MKQWEQITKLPSVPDMCFGFNEFLLKHESGFTISFNALDALSMVNHEQGPDIKVSTAEKWKESSKKQIDKMIEDKVSVQPGKQFDWTYTTEYKGTVSCPPGEIEPTDEPINTTLLTQPDPILFYDDFRLFEDELADNGGVWLTVKSRVMPTCFLVLLRFFLRVDGVLFRIYDTRVFHEFHKNYLIRDFQVKEGNYHEVVASFGEGTERGSVTDANLIDKFLTRKSTILEKIKF
uniref:TIP41-like protein n=1 Tax=Arcella intermedia TaxID=1963864 RepID=A0A6B2LE83_9EUKA